MKTNNDVIITAQVVDALRRNNKNVNITLIIPHCMYARQDRVFGDGNSLGVKVFANIINSLELNEVVICDPHSDVVTALLDNVRVVKQASVFKNILSNMSDACFIAPDSGAVKRTTEMATAAVSDSIVCMGKRRNMRDGKITKTELYGDVYGKRCVIVDDICDGGATFIAAANVLKEAGAASVELIVTHGIFTKGVKHVAQHFDKVYTANTFHQSKVLYDMAEGCDNFKVIQYFKE